MTPSSQSRSKVSRPRLALSLLVLAMVGSACGSTAPQGPEAGGADVALVGPGDDLPSDSGLTLDEGGVTPDAGGATADVDGTAPSAPGSSDTAIGGDDDAVSRGSGPAAAAGSGGKSGAPADATRSRSPASGRTGPGVTAKEIVVGIPIADDSSPGNEEIHGVSGITQGDIERYYEIVRDDINRRGGIAGRKVRYSIFRYTTADGAQRSQLEQAACAHWTQDDRAFVAGFGSSANFLTCAQKHQLATTGQGFSVADDRVFATFPHHFETSAMSLTRQMHNLPDGLESQGYFGRGYKLGVLTHDTPSFSRAVDGALAPALARHGRKISELQRISYAETNSDLGKITAEVQSAVLRFKSSGITNVVIVDASGLLTLLFTRSAENQNYRPRYGLTTQSGLSVLAPSVPEGQFDRALGIGWYPQNDVPPRELPRNAARERCLAMYERKGEQPADPNNAGIMTNICEELNFIKAAVEAALPDITFDSFLRGAESLGNRFPSYIGMGNYFAPGRHDGAAAYRRVAYDPQCTCFHYTSKPIRTR